MASFRCAMRASLLVRSACALAASARASLSSACAVMRAARSATIIAWALARSEGSDSEAAVTTRWNHTYPCRQARSSSDRGWTPSCLGMTPVDPRQKIAELGRRDRHRAVGCARPQKAAPFQPLREQARALAVVPDNLQQIAAAAAKEEQVATQRILPQHLLNPQRQAGEPLRRSVCPVASHTRTPDGIGIIAAPGHQGPGPRQRRRRQHRRLRAARGPARSPSDHPPTWRSPTPCSASRRWAARARSQPERSRALVPPRIAQRAVCDAKPEAESGRSRVASPSRIRGVGRPGSPTRSWPSRPQTSDGAGPSRRPQAPRRHCAYDRPYALFSARRTPRRKAALTESSRIGVPIQRNSEVFPIFILHEKALDRRPL